MRDTGSRILIYALLIIINALLWVMFFAFQWEVSLRIREVEFFDKQLFPTGIRIVPVPVIFVICLILSVVSVGIIIRDRLNIIARKKLQKLLGQILESLEIGVIVLDGKGQVLLTNESVRRILPGDIPLLPERNLLDVLKEYPQVETAVESAVKEGVYSKEKKYFLGTSEKTSTVQISTLPLKNRPSKESGTLVLLNDISEEVALQNRMNDSERLSTMGTLAATLAHEIRNPLEALNLNLELLQRLLQNVRSVPVDRERIDKYTRIMDSEVSRLAGVVENFLSFARPGNAMTAPIPLREVLRKVVEVIEGQAQSRNVKIGMDLSPEPVTVIGFEDRLKQLFLNLVLNGIDAMPGGGTLSIRAGTLERQTAQGPCRLAEIIVEDTGEGIEPEKLHRLFEPFFSTRSQGTGLGLTIAGRIAGEHGGQILVESIPGEGSKFTVELPVSL